MTETWRPVVGFDAYEVSSEGQVRSIDRIITTRRGIRRRLPGLTLSPKPTPGGYLIVNLYRNRRQHTRSVHQVVAEAFHGPRPAGTETRHLNGCGTDNRAVNLQWNTHTVNVRDTVDLHRTHHHTRKPRCIHGHALVAPNLAASPKGTTWRVCLACSKAVAARRRARRRGEPVPDKVQLANAIYNELAAQIREEMPA